jgi:hypothetical protein
MGWNPFKRAPKSDNRRLRDLEARVNDLADDVALSLKHVQRIDARLRQRSQKAAVEQLEADEVTPSPSPSQPSDSPGGRFSNKEQLRQLARQRGLLPQ